jgi:molecular chaperone DnaK
MENLTKASHKLAELMYDQAQSQPPGPIPSADQDQPAEETKKDSDVIDAEFEESKD